LIFTTMNDLTRVLMDKLQAKYIMANNIKWLTTQLPKRLKKSE
jgi:hypothetical protein